MSRRVVRRLHTAHVHMVITMQMPFRRLKPKLVDHSAHFFWHGGIIRHAGVSTWLVPFAKVAVLVHSIGTEWHSTARGPSITRPVEAGGDIAKLIPISRKAKAKA